MSKILELILSLVNTYLVCRGPTSGPYVQDDLRVYFFRKFAAWAALQNGRTRISRVFNQAFQTRVSNSSHGPRVSRSSGGSCRLHSQEHTLAVARATSAAKVGSAQPPPAPPPPLDWLERTARVRGRRTRAGRRKGWRPYCRTPPKVCLGPVCTFAQARASGPGSFPDVYFPSGRKPATLGRSPGRILGDRA